MNNSCSIAFSLGLAEHEWIKVDGSASHRLTCCSVQVRVKNFLKMHRLKQMAMHQIAIQLPKEMQEASKVSPLLNQVVPVCDIIAAEDATGF